MKKTHSFKWVPLIQSCLTNLCPRELIDIQKFKCSTQADTGSHLQVFCSLEILQNLHRKEGGKKPTEQKYFTTKKHLTLNSSPHLNLIWKSIMRVQVCSFVSMHTPVESSLFIDNRKTEIFPSVFLFFLFRIFTWVYSIQVNSEPALVFWVHIINFVTGPFPQMWSLCLTLMKLLLNLICLKTCKQILISI